MVDAVHIDGGRQQSTRELEEYPQGAAGTDALLEHADGQDAAERDVGDDAEEAELEEVAVAVAEAGRGQQCICPGEGALAGKTVQCRQHWGVRGVSLAEEREGEGRGKGEGQGRGREGRDGGSHRMATLWYLQLGRVILD